jgi:hypothetical protein
MTMTSPWRARRPASILFYISGALTAACALVAGFSASAQTTTAASANLSSTAVAANAPKPTAPVVAILSLIGDSLNIVVEQSKTGTNLNPNRRQQHATNSAQLDEIAIRAIAKSMQRTQPGIEFAVLNARSPILFERQRTLFAEKDGKLSMPGAILDAAKAQGATQLLVILKRRDEAAFPFINGYFADGAQLEGIGVYLDGRTEVFSRTESNQRIAQGVGFVAPYVYADLFYVDLPDGRIVRQLAVKESVQVGAGNNGGGAIDPWNALSNEQKMRNIVNMLEGAMTLAGPQLLTKAK